MADLEQFVTALRSLSENTEIVRDYIKDCEMSISKIRSDMASIGMRKDNALRELEVVRSETARVKSEADGILEKAKTEAQETRQRANQKEVEAIKLRNQAAKELENAEIEVRKMRNEIKDFKKVGVAA